MLCVTFFFQIGCHCCPYLCVYLFVNVCVKGETSITLVCVCCLRNSTGTEVFLQGAIFN
jgi:hypothetical protein